MSNRREFIKNSSLALGALAFGTSAGWENDNNLVSIAGGDAYWKNIRAGFPLSDTKVFLNNGTIGPSPLQVMEAVYKSVMYTETEASYGDCGPAGKALAEYFGAEEDEICLTRNVTEGINIICWGLDLKRGDEVIISNQEHVGNALPWLNRARVDGISLKVLDLTLPLSRLLETLESSIGKNTKVIALPHLPCTTGRVMPVKEIAAIAKRKGVLYFVDGAHGPGMLDIDLHDLDCDFYASCCHKWLLGPKGTGFIYIKKDQLERIDPKFVGAYSDTGWELIGAAPVLEGFLPRASRFFYGTQNTSIYKGVEAAVQFHKDIGKSILAKRVTELNSRLYFLLEELDRVEVITPKNERAGIVSFRIKDADYMEFYIHCRNQNVIIRAVPENNMNCLRVSTHIYNSEEEIDGFASLLQDYIRQ